MSADVWLVGPDGQEITVSYDPDDAMRDLVPMRSAGQVTATSFNLTYNLTPMLRHAGMPPWREIVGTNAGDAGQVWRRTHDALLADPEGCRALNPENGWGTYEQAVEVIGALAQACEEHPDATVGGWL